MKLLVRKSAFLMLMLLATSYLFAQDEIIEKRSPESEGEVFTIVDEMPVFIEGEERMSSSLGKYISENLEYPEVARANNIVGRVYVQFVVNPEGYVKDAKVIRGVDKCIDDEALRVISSMPRWAKPGKQRGNPVGVSFTIPINFSLTSNNDAE